MLKEFKQFALRGNVMDMAIGIILGGAFLKIVNSFVSDILMPPIGMLLEGVDFSKMVYVLKAKTATSAAITINYGTFINAIVDFLIVAFVIFIIIKQLNKILPKKEEIPVTKPCPQCCSSINVNAKRCPQCTAEI